MRDTYAGGYLYPAHDRAGAEPVKPVPDHDPDPAGTVFAQRVRDYQLCDHPAGASGHGDSGRA